MIVGGRDFNERKIDVEQAMKGELAEAIREHYVEVNGAPYPPKQVLSRVTGWDRASFTTMEAQRVLTKLGFECMRVRRNADGLPAWFPENVHGLDASDATDDPEDPQAKSQKASDRTAALEAGLATAQLAIANLASRLEVLEQSA